MRYLMIICCIFLLSQCVKSPEATDSHTGVLVVDTVDAVNNGQFTKLRYVAGNNRIYIADIANANIQVYDLPTHGFLTPIDLGGKAPVDLDVGADWLFIGLSNEIKIVSVNNYDSTHTIAAPANHSITSLSTDDGKLLYVGYIDSTGSSGQILKYDLASLANGQAPGGATPLDSHAYIIGHNKTRNRLYTASAKRVARRVREWDLGRNPAENKDLGAIFGEAYSDPGNIVAEPNGTRLFAFSQGDPRYSGQNRQWFGDRLYDGALPVVNRDDLSVQTQFLPYQVTALSMDGEGKQLVVAHAETVINPTPRQRHPASQKDLHVFTLPEFKEDLIDIGEFNQVNHIQQVGKTLYIIAVTGQKHQLKIVNLCNGCG